MLEVLLELWEVLPEEVLVEVVILDQDNSKGSLSIEVELEEATEVEPIFQPEDAEEA